MIDNRQDGEQLAMPGFEPEPPAAETIKKQLPVVQFRMDFLRSPEDALLKWGQMENGRYRKWFTGHFDKLVAIVAQQTGADPAQIADKNKRTPEQQQLLFEAAAKQQIARIDAFFDSLYMDAINTLEPLQGVYKDPGEIDFYTDTDRFNPDSEFISVKEQAVLYFFALHDELKPTEKQILTTEQKEELQGIYSRLDAFYLERTGGGDYSNMDILFAFIERENPTPETAESIAAKLPLVQGIRPTAHTMPNNALMNTLQQKPAINAGAFDMVVANAKGRRKEITAYTMIEFDPGETSIKITDAHLSEYERQVSDAVISLWIEAVKEKLPPIFTPDMIFRAMPGGSDSASPQQKGAITKTIEKFRRLYITVDATEEMRKRGVIGSNATFKLDNFYLSATHAEYKVKNGGQTVNAYKIDTEPIILTYCNMTKQLLTVPAKYLAVEKVKKGRASGELVTMTADRQAMTGYMLRRIAVMKHDRKNKVQTQSNVILFDTLFSETGTKTDNRKQTMINRNFCFDVLDYWKVSGFIKGYTKQEKGRSITGIVIEF
jgi:hypothetical protein